MMDWQAQNDAQWRMIQFVLQVPPRAGVLWITCEQFQHRQLLLKEFQERFPQYAHTIGKVDGFQDGSLPYHLRDVFIANGGKADTETPQMFHVSGLERFLSHTSDKGDGGFFEALNFERPLFFNALPFVLVFWTDEHCLIQTHRLAPDFWDWLTKKFHFEAPPMEAMPLAADAQDEMQRYWVMPSAEETELLHNRNARLLALVDEQRSDADRISLWVGLADNFFKLRDFEQSIHFGKLALAAMGPDQQEDRLWQLKLLTDSLLVWGQQAAVKGEIESARSLFEEVLASLPNDKLLAQRGSALKSLGDLGIRLGNVDAARKLYEKAITHYQTERANLGLANALHSLGDLDLLLGNVDAARKFYEEAIVHFQTERNNLGLANALQSLGSLERRLGNLDAARKLYEESIAHYQTERSNIGLANALRKFGDLERLLGNVEAARQRYMEAIIHYKSEQDNLGLGWCKWNFAVMAFDEGQYSGAEGLLQEALSLFQSVHSPHGMAQSNVLLAEIAHRNGETTQRDAYFAQAQKYAADTHLPHFIASVQSLAQSWLPDSDSPL